MESGNKYDLAIVGGGLAGLALSIQLARQGHAIILFEKEQYPFHRVCGEYISLESWDFLTNLGVDLDKMQVPIITQLQVSGVDGKLLQQKLPQGGFGLSRYRMDYELVKIARREGVLVLDNTRVNDLRFEKDECVIETSHQVYRASVVAATYGKRSNIDIKWKRPFTRVSRSKLNNYVGVKYHIKMKFPADTIALHNFDNGYCGIVKIEDDKHCLCYLTTASNLQKVNGDIKDMEHMILSRNPHLKKIWAESQIIYESPLTISQVSFNKKSQVDRHALMVGDAAGMIAPLCGNGMSMALHGSKIAAATIHSFLRGDISREEMEQQYKRSWHKNFSHRLKTGRRIQRLFGKKWVTDIFISLARFSPRFLNSLIQQTHGKPF